MENLLKRNLRQYTMLIALALIWLVFSVLTEGIFVTPGNLSNLFVQTVTTAVLAVGMTLVIVAGHIDLSVGSALGFTGAVAVVLMIKAGMGAFASLGLTILVGAAIGAWHGFWVAYRRVPAFIVTLASMLALRGAIIGITGGQTQSLEMAAPAAAETFRLFGQKYLPRLDPSLPLHDLTLLVGILAIAAFLVFEWRRRAARQRHGFAVPTVRRTVLRNLLVSLAIAAFFGLLAMNMGMPYSLLILVGLVIVVTFVAERTVFGRQLYAIGGNLEAARLSGINVKARVFQLFMLMGAITALAGVIAASRGGSVESSAGQNAELDAIAAVVIGGASLMGGRGTIIGAMIGALVMASLDNGMSLMSLEITWQYVVKGMILLGAVWVDMAGRKA